MKQDFQMALKNSGKLSLGGEGSPVYAVNGDEELLTLTEGIVGQWKEYFEDFNSTDMCSDKEAELEESGVGSLITGVEFRGVAIIVQMNNCTIQKPATVDCRLSSLHVQTGAVKTALVAKTKGMSSLWEHLKSQ